MADSLVHAFRVSARTHAGRPAIIVPGRTWTYAELDAETDRLAGALHRRVGATGVRIAVALDNGPDALLATWAILKAGCVQVPMDTGWPADQWDRALARIQPALLVQATGTEPPGGALPCASIEELAAAPGGPLPALPGDRTPACIHLTSGRTGAPKGVVLSHGCWLHSARTYQHHLALVPEDRMTWTAPFAYGAAAGTYITAALAGAALLPIRPRETPLREWVDWIGRERASVMMIAMSLFRTLARHLPEGPNLPHLRLVKLGGEPAYPADAELFQRRLAPSCELVNGYGITEAGTNVAFYHWVRGAPLPGPTIPVGYASQDVELLVVDESGAPLPPGRTGEVAVRSAWLADGYWQDPELTRTRWIASPDHQAPMLRTGDAGRLDEGGCLLLLGPMETRLKVRGYQVEAAVVESALRTLDGVEDAAVAVRELGGSEKLVAWLEGPGAAVWTASAIRRQLGGRLADPMLPSLAQATVLPRLRNGKLDLTALQARPIEVPTRGISEGDATERQLTLLWEKALGVRGIGLQDNFYDLGGDSLAAVSLFTLVEQRLGAHLGRLHISDCPSVAAMAARLRGAPDAGLSPSAILLQPGDGSANFFCAPGGGSDAASLVDLARRMGPCVNFYGLQLPGMDGEHPLAETVEATAEALERGIRRLQPTGPYLLGGASFGGLVAIEVARRLVQAGESVSRLILLDVYGPGSLGTRPGLSPWGRLRAWLFLNFRPRPRRMAEGGVRRTARWIREQSHRVRSWWWWRTGRDPKDLPRELRMDYYARLCHHASLRYRYPPVPVPVDLVTAEEQLPGDLFLRPLNLGWIPLAAAGLRVHTTPGSHSSMLREPLVARSAEVLTAILGGAASPPSRTLPDRTRDIWNQLADWWDGRLGEDGRSPASRLLEADVSRLLGPPAGRRILELACGNGWLARRLAARGARVTATDFSERLLEHARRRTAEAGLSVEYRVLDVTAPGDWEALPPGGYDAAVCQMGLMDMAEVTLLFRELARRLTPGAPFVFTIVDPSGEGLATTAADQILTGIGLHGQPVPHYYFHRPLADLLGEAARAGFRADAVQKRTAPPEAGLARSDFLVVRLLAPTGPDRPP